MNILLNNLDKNNVELIHQDNLTYLKKQLENKFDLIITSPPYRAKFLSDGQLDIDSYFNFSELSIELYRCLKPGKVLIWQVQDPLNGDFLSPISFRQVLNFINLGFKLFDTFIHVLQTNQSEFLSLTSRENRYIRNYHYVFILVKEDSKFFTHYDYQNNISQKSNVQAYNFDGTVEKEILKSHTGIMPESLAKELIMSWSNPGDLVFDPFLGAGTSAVSSLELGRNFIGTEINKDYVLIAENRVKRIFGL